MHTKFIVASALLAASLAGPVRAEETMQAMAHDMAAEHGGGVFHAFRFEADYGGGSDNYVGSWDLDGWIGSDENKLWLKSEGDYKKAEMESAEVWALYSRNVATFWDAQAGIRLDIEPTATTYAVFGVNGLAPYFFETEAHMFVSNRGDVSARLREENDFLLTQKLILQPYAEITLYAQDVPSQEVGRGLADGKIGLQVRYEFTRKIAPYVDVHYGRKFGRTASLAESEGVDTEEVIGAIGLRLMF